MSQYGNEDEFEDDNSGLPEPARKRLRDLEKTVKQLQKERDEAAKSANEYRLRDVLNERGLNDPRVTKFITASGVDVSDSAAVDGWLNENGDLFGYQRQPQGEATAGAQEQAAAIQQMNQSEAGGIPDNQHDNVLAQIRAASSDDLPALLAKLSPQIKSGI